VLRAASTLVLVAVLAGCGSSHNELTHGRHVFAAACSGCHTLTGHPTSAPGGDLGSLLLSTADVESFAAIMPVRPRISQRDLRSVALFVKSR
jgi:mono/diheme cytochrome c family protein